MAEQFTGRYEEVIDLRPSREAMCNLLECNRKLKADKKELTKQLEVQKERTKQLEVLNVESIAEKLNLNEEIKFTKELYALERSKNADKDWKLARQQQIINEMNAQACQKRKVTWISALNDSEDCFQQDSTEQSQMKKMREKIETQLSSEKQMKAMHNEQILKLENEIKHLKEQNELLILKNKTLSEDNRRLQPELRNLAYARYSLFSIKRQDRLEINIKCLECKQCHQAFSSFAEMHASQCLYHPANPSPTDTNGTHFWKCCQAKAAGKSPPGCKKGIHVPKYPDRETSRALT